MDPVEYFNCAIGLTSIDGISLEVSVWKRHKLTCPELDAVATKSSKQGLVSKSERSVKIVGRSGGI